MSKQTDLLNLTDAITVSGSNVGIGTSSPSRNLHVYSGSEANIRLQGGSDYAELRIKDSDNALTFHYGGSETMRNSGAEFHIGHTGGTVPWAMSGSQYGISLLGSGGFIGAARANAEPLLLNRTGSAGAILNFRKDGSTIGSIGCNSGSHLVIGRDDTGLNFQANEVIAPSNPSTGASRDNAIDLGASGARFDDIYATNGTIQTSDRNEKQDIEALSDAEQRVAVACKGLLRKFRWIDAVAEKGDDARIHFGIIAQDLQDAFAAEGLDAGRYAMFISSTWWETQTEVPAVEAVAEVLDEDGNVVTEAVEAKEAYTRTDTYETLEEAPEGATERTRLGVRYPELLAFIIGAM